MQVPHCSQKVLILKNGFRQFSNSQRKDSLQSSSHLRWALADPEQPRRKSLSWKKTIWRSATRRRPM